MRTILLKYLNLPTFQLPDGGGATSSPSGSDGGAASSPSTSPTAAAGPDAGASTPSPSTETPSSAGEEVIDFGLIFNGDDDGAASAPTVQTETPAPAPVAKPPAAPAAEPPKTPVAAQPTPPTDTPAAAPPVPKATTAAPTAQLDPFDPGALAHALTQNMDAAVTHLASTTFKLTPEQAAELEENTLEAVPKLLARTFAMAQVNMFQQMSRVMPAMIAKHAEVTKRHSENESQFYARWPELNKLDPEVQKTVTQYAVVYRQMHPEISLQHMIEAVGPMVMMKLGIQPGSRPQAAPTAPRVPVSPLAPTGVRPPQATPFAPAGPVAGGPAMAPIPEAEHPAVTMFTHDE